jgi:hypothetical protein
MRWDRRNILTSLLPIGLLQLIEIQATAEPRVTYTSEKN